MCKKFLICYFSYFSENIGHAIACPACPLATPLRYATGAVKRVFGEIFCFSHGPAAASSPKISDAFWGRPPGPHSDLQKILAEVVTHPKVKNEGKNRPRDPRLGFGAIAFFHFWPKFPKFSILAYF